jgi:acylphosphatase
MTRVGDNRRDPLLAKHIVVHGRVQGVGYRYFVQRIGARLGVTGDVRNLPDSTVEILVEGSADKIEEFIREVSRGPSLSRVERVDVHDMTAGGRYGSFLVEGW